MGCIAIAIHLLKSRKYCATQCRFVLYGLVYGFCGDFIPPCRTIPPLALSPFQLAPIPNPTRAVLTQVIFCVITVIHN